MIILFSDALIEQGPHEELYYDFVQTIMIAYKEGKHVVIISAANVMKMINDEGIDAASKLYLRYYQAHEKEVTSYINLFKVVIEVIPSAEIETSRCDLSTRTEYRSLNFTKLSDTATIQKTIVLGENGNDSKVYGRIAEYYISRKNLKPFNLNYKEQTGGGSTLCDEYKKIYEIGQEFCLCIVDSDRKAPTLTIGETAKQVITYHNKKVETSPNAKCHCHVLDCLELENLFPAKFYAVQYSGKEFKETHERLSIIENYMADALLFHDYKKGLRLFYNYSNEKIIEYWYTLLGPGWSILVYNDLEYYFKGFGDNVLANFVSYDPTQIYSYLDGCPRLKPVWLELGKMISSFVLGTKRKNAI